MLTRHTQTEQGVTVYIQGLGETEADLTFLVEAMGKLATMWGASKNRD